MSERRPDPAARDLRELVHAWQTGAASAEEAAELARRIRESPADARRVAEWMLLESDLAESLTSDLPSEKSNPLASIDGTSRFNGSWTRIAIAAALLMAAAVVVVVVMTAGPGATGTPDERRERPVATVTETRGAVFGSRPLNPGDEVTPQLIRTEAGEFEMVLTSGALVDLTGPGELQLDGPLRVTLTRGLGRFTCPPGAEGFTVDLPDGFRAVDLGTEFAIRADPAGPITLEVHRGRVRLERGAGDAAWADELTAGETALVDDAGRVRVGRADELGVRPLRSIAADFADDAHDAFPGDLGQGWAGPWRTIGEARADIANEQPLTADGGRYLAATRVGAQPGAGFVRPFHAFAGVDPSAAYIVSVDVRIDSPGTTGFQVGVRENEAVNTGPDVLTWAKVNGGVWEVFDGRGDGVADTVQTHLPATPGAVYRVTFWIDPVERSAVASIDNLDDDAPAYVSHAMGLRSLRSAERPHVFIGTQASGAATAFSADAVVVTVPAPGSKPPRPRPVPAAPPASTTPTR